MKRLLITLASLLVLQAAHAAYPERPVTLIVPFAPGGATDIVARTLAAHMSKTLGQNFIVDNVSGAGGTIGARKAAHSAPDGYTLLMGSLGPNVASVGLYPKLPYSPRTDLEPVIKAVLTPMVVSVRKDLPVRDFREFVQYLKQNGSKTNFASGGSGAQSHLLCLFLGQVTGTSATHVPYRGSGPAMTALLAQEIDFTCDQAIGVLPHMKSGAIRPLVVARANRIAVMPDVPSAPEQGHPKFDADGWLAIFASKDTPKPIIDQLNKAARAALSDEAVKRKLIELGNEIPPEADLSPEALRTLIDQEIERWVPIIKKSGVATD